jgi:hypothetical protein
MLLDQDTKVVRIITALAVSAPIQALLMGNPDVCQEQLIRMAAAILRRPNVYKVKKIVLPVLSSTAESEGYEDLHQYFLNPDHYDTEGTFSVSKTISKLRLLLANDNKTKHLLQGEVKNPANACDLLYGLDLENVQAIYVIDYLGQNFPWSMQSNNALSDRAREYLLNSMLPTIEIGSLDQPSPLDEFVEEFPEIINAIITYGSPTELESLCMATSIAV